MTLDDRRLSRLLHMLSLAFAVAALSAFLVAMGRLVPDELTTGTSLAIAAAFVGLPAMIGLTAWSDRAARRTPVMSSFLVLCGLLAACMLTVAVRLVVADAGAAALGHPFAGLGFSISLAIAAAFVRDRGHGAAVA